MLRQCGGRPRRSIGPAQRVTCWIRAPALVLVDEKGGPLGILHDNLDPVPEYVKVRNRDAIDRHTITAARQDADAPAEGCHRQGGVEGGAAEDGRSVRQDIGTNMADEHVIGRALGLQTALAVALPRLRLPARWPPV